MNTLDEVSGTGEDGAEASRYLLLRHPLSTSMSSYGFSFDGGSLKTIYTQIITKTVQISMIKLFSGNVTT